MLSERLRPRVVAEWQATQPLVRSLVIRPNLRELEAHDPAQINHSPGSTLTITHLYPVH